MEQGPDYARIHKIIPQDPRLLSDSLRKNDWNFTERGETTAKHLLEMYFLTATKDKHDLRPQIDSTSGRGLGAGQTNRTVERLRLGYREVQVLQISW